MTKHGMAVKRIIIVGCLLILLGCYAAYVLHRVQIRRHEELLSKARKKYTGKKEVIGKRGEIFDRRGNLLVGNQPCTEICVDPSILPDEQAAEALADYFHGRLKGIDREKLLKKLKQRERTRKMPDGTIRKIPSQYVLVASFVEYGEAQKIEEEIRSLLAAERKKKKNQDKRIIAQWKSVSFRPGIRRVYPKHRLCANIIGFTKIENGHFIALSGLERVFDENMTGGNGLETFERNRVGVPLSFGTDVKKKTERDGWNVYLTISEPIQSIVEEELAKAVAQFKPAGAWAVMADPMGNLLAAAQLPTFDPGDPSTRTDAAIMNRLVLNAFEPGSVMKPLSIAAAVDAGVVTPETIIDCEKKAWAFAGKRLNDTHYIGKRSVTDVLNQSSNIGTAKIAILLGEKRLDEYLRKFGLGSRTGLPFGVESKGLYRPVHRWSKLSISRISIGQGISVSPMQLVRAYCMLANNGHPVKLNLLHHLSNPETGEILRCRGEIPPSIFRDPSTGVKIRAMMKTVVAKGGTGTKAAVPGYHVAGKTGTAQKAGRGGYSKSKYVGSFIGFVPADRPRFILLVSMDEPDKKLGYYGGTVAGPVFSRIAERTLKYLSIPPDFAVPEKTPKKKPAVEKAPKKRETPGKNPKRKQTAYLRR